MKLTKGKISKLYKKNKQSVRRRKNGKGKTGRNKTFRKTKSLNLANKSLKNFHQHQLFLLFFNLNVVKEG